MNIGSVGLITRSPFQFCGSGQTGEVNLDHTLPPPMKENEVKCIKIGRRGKLGVRPLRRGQVGALETRTKSDWVAPSGCCRARVAIGSHSAYFLLGVWILTYIRRKNRDARCPRKKRVGFIASPDTENYGLLKTSTGSSTGYREDLSYEEIKKIIDELENQIMENCKAMCQVSIRVKEEAD